MKYKIGDKVKILRVGDVTDPKVNVWIGQASRIKEVNPTGLRDGYDYYLENEFHAYENELELVPEFKVGDRVRIKQETGYSFAGALGTITRVLFIDRSAEFLYDVVLDKPAHGKVGYGWAIEKGGIELIAPEFKVGDPEFKVGDRVVIAHAEGNDSSLRPNEMGVVCNVARFPTKHPYEVEFPDGEKILYMGKELELALYVPVGTEKQKATTTFSLLGKDGFYYDAEFVNIGFELFRSYLFPATSRDTGMSVCGSKVYETLSDAHIVRIDNPKWLYVAPSGSHRIIDKHGRSHYIPCGWTHLWWKVEGGVEKGAWVA